MKYKEAHAQGIDKFYFVFTEVKDGDCPAASGAGICAEMCKTDSGCPNEQKCCINGCGAHQCTAPAATTCTYQSEHYPIGHRRQQDSCTTCLCKDPNSKQQWECVSISCPRLPCYSTKIIPNLCCPVCDGKCTARVIYRHIWEQYKTYELFTNKCYHTDAIVISVFVVY